MTPLYRRRRIALVLALLPLAACNPETRPEEDRTVSGDTAATGDTLATAPPGPTSFLLCPRDTAATEAAITQSIGPAGGTLRLGRNELQIPADALSSSHDFRFEKVGGDSVGVSVQPSVRFASGRRGNLVIDAEYCGAALRDTANWVIWRMRPGRPHALSTVWRAGRAHAQLDSTSGYVIAGRTAPPPPQN